MAIYRKLSIVFHPATVLSSYESPDGVTSHSLALNDWDLWGPLFLCLILAISLSFMAPPSEAANIFTLIFFLVWFGSGVITINAKLLGGQVCFFQSVCILGYCLAPQAIAAVISCLFITWKPIKLTYLSGAFVWSITGKFLLLYIISFIFLY